MSPRVLSREAAHTQHEQRRTATLVADPVPGSADQAHPYFDRPATPQERTRVFAAGVELVRQWLPESRGPATGRDDAERVVGRLLDYLDSVAGASYQQRWMSCGADAAGKDWLPPYASGPSKRLGARQALNALLVLGRYPAQHSSGSWSANRRASGGTGPCTTTAPLGIGCSRSASRRR